MNNYYKIFFIKIYSLIIGRNVYIVFVVIAFLLVMQLELLKLLIQGFLFFFLIDILWSIEQYDGKKYLLFRYFKNDLKVKKNCLNVMLLKYFFFIFQLGNKN